ncbi:hypothetical protein H5410_061247 [Solanum commersonii]|uniref:Uncharacterized protein n=1 Tax=Solanum commersonii TaxID=4109 RepID=A0A9J5W7K6_SOLCO|nr:hypothetical protein H5410_061247 [Solanum commersonii]
MRFKMKSLNTENEVDSNMKSTIRYTFVAPSAIGKGRERGLKSLGEKGSLLSKSLLPQSSDLVKKFYREGQRQGLKNSTMSTSQGTRMMHKNSMAPEKETMQINTSSLVTNQVNKYTQELETRKGLEKGIRSLSSYLGISKYEVGSFNKSADFDNQHMEIPSKCTKLGSNMSSNKKMQKMKKIVLEKEDMQTNVSLPPSVNQVMNHSQTTEKCMIF